MAETEITHGILTFAHQLAEGADESAIGLAQRQRWIDEEGRATREGRALFVALGDQRGTRSVIRNVL
jgi:hypothetical protein